MTTELAWPAFTSTDSAMDVLIKLSRYYGSNPAFVLAGGGNTSAKIGDKLYVKGSGHALATIGPEGFVEMDRARLQAILTTELPSGVNEREEAFKNMVMAARNQPEKGQRPSVEVVLHELLPRQFVVHTHATLVNMLTCCVKGEALVAELFGDAVCWVPFVDPGYILARTLAKTLEAYKARTGKDCPRAVIMQNHGLIICGDTPEAVKADTEWIIGKLEEQVAKVPATDVFGAVSRIAGDEAKALINTIAPALRGLLAEETGEGLSFKVVTFDDSDLVLSLAGGADGREVAVGGPLCPDQIVYCKSFPLWFEATAGESEADLVARLREAVTSHTAKTKFAPKVVIVKGLGLFGISDSFVAARTVVEVYSDAIQVMGGARRMGGIQYMTQRDREFIDNWEVESYRRKIAAGSARPGRAANKVALVTGAAQGFGLEIATDLVAHGAHVVLADLNVEGAMKSAETLCAKYGKGKAMGLAMNVTDQDSVRETLHQMVRALGGLDVIVANAGVVKAGSVKVQPLKDFNFVTAVNYTGYFLCVQATAPIMGVQAKAQPGVWFDIIQVNSKSGLEGSNKNGAYAGSKFGGLGLTQSFAMELVEDHIKVNSICPGNFLDGPLWSDPDRGLFVQYLKSGKVPGAKTVADVRKAYEAKVPMGRGCSTPDVMKAVYYLMEQQYETGQAVPVTGGQVMLK